MSQATTAALKTENVSPLVQAFASAADKGRAAFIPFMTAGYPDPETFIDLITGLAGAGADVIEIGLPFSDPLADGPVIQAAGRTVLDAGLRMDNVFDLTARAAGLVDCPLVLMTYYNPVLARGLAEFARRAAAAGAAGVIIPDLPPEEAGPWRTAAQAAGLETIVMVAPTTTDERLAVILQAARGFVYYVSTTGVTGSGMEVSRDLKAGLDRLKGLTDLPVAVGFGVAVADTAAQLAALADGVIVGSALVKAAADGTGTALDLARCLAGAMDRGAKDNRPDVVDAARLTGQTT